LHKDAFQVLGKHVRLRLASIFGPKGRQQGSHQEPPLLRYGKRIPVLIFATLIKIAVWRPASQDVSEGSSWAVSSPSASRTIRQRITSPRANGPWVLLPPLLGEALCAGGGKKVCGVCWSGQRHVSKMMLCKGSSALTIPRPWSGG